MEWNRLLISSLLPFPFFLQILYIKCAYFFKINEKPFENYC